LFLPAFKQADALSEYDKRISSMTDLNNFDGEELVALAHAALNQQNFDSALEKLKRVLAGPNPPGDAVALTAQLYAQLGLYAKAEKLYRRYVDANPMAINERFQLGLTYVGMGKSNEALQLWEKVLAEVPNHIPTLYYKAFVMAQTGKLAEAKTILDSFLAFLPADNPYFANARQLLQAIAASTPAKPPAGNGTPIAANVAKGFEPYRTEK
jgi:tetratricopeptide (TPR) repeat protein